MDPPYRERRVARVDLFARPRHALVRSSLPGVVPTSVRDRSYRRCRRRRRSRDGARAIRGILRARGKYRLFGDRVRCLAFEAKSCRHDFDYAASYGVLHHIRSSAGRGRRRALRPGGRWPCGSTAEKATSSSRRGRADARPSPRALTSCWSRLAGRSRWPSVPTWCVSRARCCAPMCAASSPTSRCASATSTCTTS